MVSRDLQDHPANRDCPVAKDIQELMDARVLQDPKERLDWLGQRVPVEWTVVAVLVEQWVCLDPRDSKEPVELLVLMETLAWTAIQDRAVNKVNQERRATKDASERLVFADLQDLVDCRELKDLTETGEMMANRDQWEPLGRWDRKDTAASSVNGVWPETSVRQEKWDLRECQDLKDHLDRWDHQELSEVLEHPARMEPRDPTVTQAMPAWLEDRETRDQAEKTAPRERTALQERLDPLVQ